MWALARAARIFGLALGLTVAAASASVAQDDDRILIYFDSGSAEISPSEIEKLDLAARTFRAGDPLVMFVTGTADRTGPADGNLALSVDRAATVADALIDRGIPAERLFVVGKGEAEVRVQTDDNIAEQGNRAVEITWR